MRRDPYRHYRRSMRRNWRTRHGGYPVIWPVPYEPVAAMAFAVLGRGVYRHRSAFLPFVITGTAFVLAAIAHRHHPGTHCPKVSGLTGSDVRFSEAWSRSGCMLVTAA
jgi:hypothetical protein